MPHFILALAGTHGDVFPYSALAMELKRHGHRITMLVNDGQTSDALPQHVADFVDLGDPPIVFTVGTGMQHAHQPFRTAVETCH